MRLPSSLGSHVVPAAMAVCLALLLSLFALLHPTKVDEASAPLTPTARPLPVETHAVPSSDPPAAQMAPLPPISSVKTLVREGKHQRQVQLAVLHRDLWLHAAGTQLYTAWNKPMALRAINWYGFEYAPFVPDGLDQAPLDSILSLVHALGFNALRITFADATVASNPVVTRGVKANPNLKGLHALDIMQRLLERAHHYRLRVILCNTRSEPGMGPELKSGLWYTAAYPESVWESDWVELVTRFRQESAFVAADLRNEPHMTGSVFDLSSYFKLGPLWGQYQGTYYHDRDWHYAAQTLGNRLLQINPNLMIVVEGVQLYLDPYRNSLTGGLWGSNLIGVQYDQVTLSRPSQLMYSIHEYGPKMWKGKWFNARTSYDRLARRWTRIWGYVLTAPKFMQAPILVGEFGSCDDHYSCVASPRQIPDSQGFWFTAFVRYLQAHPRVSWAYWALNPIGPFQPNQRDFYSLMSYDWRHYFPTVTYGLRPILGPRSGVWEPAKVTAPDEVCTLLRCSSDPQATTELPPRPS